MTADPVVERFIETHADQVARLLETTGADAMRDFLAVLSTLQVASIMRYLSRHSACHYLATLDADRAVAIIKILPPQYAASLVRDMPLPARQALLAGESMPYRIRTILRYPKGSVGAEMDSNPISLHEGMTAKQARTFLKKYRQHICDSLFVTGSEQRFVGVIALKELLFAKNTANIASLCKPPMQRLSPWDALAAVGLHPGWQQVAALPVIERGGRLSGILHADRVREAMSMEAVATTLSGDLADDIFAPGELFWSACADLLSDYDTATRSEPA
ncbi:MAG: CBS domain-containing protein [Gammaproteobacteria bacterium]|nr:CBS domain-containing protein [Gammaproteobacteria bacterium]